MGIHGFNQFIKNNYPDIIHKEHISLFAYERIFLDISSFIYKYLFVYGDETNEWIKHLINFFILFKKNKIRLVPVFDGKPPQEKQDEINSRKLQREKTTNKIEQVITCFNNYNQNIHSDNELEILKDIINKNKNRNLFNDGNNDKEKNILSSKDIEYINDYIQKNQKNSVYVKQKHTDQLKEALTELGIPFIQADGETESLCCSLVKQKLGVAVISIDSDCFAYRCPIVINDIDKFGKISIIFTKELCENLQLSEEELIDFCILCGCDYNILNKLPNVGPSTALKLIKTYKKIENIDKYKIEQLELLNYKRCRDLFNFENNKIYNLIEEKTNIEKFLKWCEINDIVINIDDIIYINDNIDNEIIIIDS